MDMSIIQLDRVTQTPILSSDVNTIQLCIATEHLCPIHTASAKHVLTIAIDAEKLASLW